MTLGAKYLLTKNLDRTCERIYVMSICSIHKKIQTWDTCQNQWSTSNFCAISAGSPIDSSQIRLGPSGRILRPKPAKAWCRNSRRTAHPVRSVVMFWPLGSIQKAIEYHYVHLFYSIFIGKSAINGPCSIVMLVYQRAHLTTVDSRQSDQ